MGILCLSIFLYFSIYVHLVSLTVCLSWASSWSFIFSPSVLVELTSFSLAVGLLKRARRGKMVWVHNLSWQYRCHLIPICSFIIPFFRSLLSLSTPLKLLNCFGIPNTGLMWLVLKLGRVNQTFGLKTVTHFIRSEKTDSSFEMHSTFARLQWSFSTYLDENCLDQCWPFHFLKGPLE